MIRYCKYTGPGVKIKRYTVLHDGTDVGWVRRSLVPTSPAWIAFRPGPDGWVALVGHGRTREEAARTLLPS